MIHRKRLSALTQLSVWENVEGSVSHTCTGIRITWKAWAADCRRHPQSFRCKRSGVGTENWHMLHDFLRGCWYCWSRDHCCSVIKLMESQLRKILKYSAGNPTENRKNGSWSLFGRVANWLGWLGEDWIVIKWLN